MKNKMICMAIDDEPMALSVISNFCERRTDVELTVFADPEEALRKIDEIKPELIFLDIEIGSQSGLHIAKQLPKNCVIIITTAYAEYAIDGYDLGVVDFLHKPFAYSRFEKALDKAALVIDYMRSKKVSQVITVREEYLNVPIPLSEIIYIEAMNNYCRIFRVGNVCTMTRMTMKSLIELLPPEGFIRIHRSFVVSLDKITGFNKSEVTLVGGKTIPVGRQYSDFLTFPLPTMTKMS